MRIAACKPVESSRGTTARWIGARLRLLFVVFVSTARAEDRIIAPPGPTRVPAPLRQGVFLAPQSIAALEISPDGRQLAVVTMGFRHDNNFWLLAEDGRVLWGRYLDPWAPWQVAFLPTGKRFAVGLAYSRVTMPNPSLAFFDAQHDAPILGCDAAWELGWMRYGGGDWRTGWMPSLLGDMLAPVAEGVFTAPFSVDEESKDKPGNWRRDPRPGQRAWRMAAAADGRVLVSGFIAADNRKAQVRGVPSLESPEITLAATDAATGTVRWKAEPISPWPAVPLPPEPSDEFPALAADFRLKPCALVPFRTAMSVAASRDGSRAACTEYGGYARIGQERIHPNWSPRHPVWLCPRQQGWLRLFGAGGEELARSPLPRSGLFDVRLSPDGSLVWCVPMSWFARGLAGCPWLPADEEAHTVYLFDAARRQWTSTWRFPDALCDFAVHPESQISLASCWDGRLYLVHRDGTLRATIEVGGPARLHWSTDGRFAVAGTQEGEVWRVDADGKIVWHTAIPVREPAPLTSPIKPVFEEVPIYRVGRVGSEHAYVGDIWLIKTSQGGILMDTAGTSAIPATWERLKSAGVDRRHVRHVLLSHTHGDHAGAAYLWRSLGAQVVAPAPAAFPATWMIPTLNHYSIWVPCAIDKPLPLARPGDTARFTLDGIEIRAIFAPGHSFDSVVYAMELAGKRVIFTGDVAFHGTGNILDRCWGDLPKARTVIRIIREQVLPLRPEIMIAGHHAQRNAGEYWQNIVRASEDAVRAAEAR